LLQVVVPFLEGRELLECERVHLSNRGELLLRLRQRPLDVRPDVRGRLDLRLLLRIVRLPVLSGLLPRFLLFLPPRRRHRTALRLRRVQDGHGQVGAELLDEVLRAQARLFDCAPLQLLQLHEVALTLQPGRVLLVRRLRQAGRGVRPRGAQPGDLALEACPLAGAQGQGLLRLSQPGTGPFGHPGGDAGDVLRPVSLPSAGLCHARGLRPCGLLLVGLPPE
jgi:hypothetical protein